MKQQTVWVVVATILAIAAMLKANPYLIYNMPKGGALTGHLLLGLPMPPMLDIKGFSECMTAEGCPWLKENSVVVSSCAKCGTHWMLTVVHELRSVHKPQIRDFNDTTEIFGWPELVTYPGESVKERASNWPKEFWNEDYDFSLFKTHLAPHTFSSGEIYSSLPVTERQDVKFIVVVRNPLDAIKSAQEFLGSSISDEQQSLWSYSSDVSANIEEFWNLALKDSDYYDNIGFLAKWIPYKILDNVFFIHYTEMRKNPKSVYRKLAEFLELKDVTEEDIELVHQRSTFKFMKEHSGRYLTMVGRNHDVPMLRKGLVTRKGGARNAKKELSPEFIEKIHKTCESNLGSFCALLEEGFIYDYNKKTFIPSE